MTCSVCGRELKSAESRKLGYGPVCYRKVFGSTPKSQKASEEDGGSDFPYYEIPGQMNIEDFLPGEDV